MRGDGTSNVDRKIVEVWRRPMRANEQIWSNESVDQVCQTRLLGLQSQTLKKNIPQNMSNTPCM